MEEALVYIVGGVVAAWAAFMILWIAVAAILRVFAWVLVFWAVTALLGFAGGILAGVVLPVRVLRGMAYRQPELASPDAVVDGTVLGAAPKGHAKHFGWDYAWPSYNPHQAKRDANAVLSQAKRTVIVAFLWLFTQDFAAVWAFVLLPSFVLFAIGTCLSVLVWYCVMALVGGAFYLVQLLAAVTYRSFDRMIRRRRKATLRCAMCYRETSSPSYRCSNQLCSRVHHDVRPGPLGIVHRRCGCGTSLPATVGRAAKSLVTVCPFCLKDVPKGSGTRHVLLLPVIGAVGAGKTQFLSSAVIELRTQLESQAGSLTPISSAAETFLKTASAAVDARQRVEKTAWESSPEGVPLVIDLRGNELEIQLLDAAGENFVDWERSQGLGYIDSADVLLFILDPLALTKVNEQLRIANKDDTVPVAQGDPEDSYASVVDRLRAEDVRLASKSLAIVLTKLDVLETLPDLGPLDPSDAASIKDWLRRNGADGFVRRVDQDFSRAVYFAIDSFTTRDGQGSVHPIRVLDWALKVTDQRFGVIPKLVVTQSERGAT